MATTTEDLIRDAVIEALDNALESNIYKPEFLAQIFANMDSRQQADFFNEITNIVKTWNGSSGQWLSMNKHLTQEAKHLISEINNYANLKE